ncbi:RAB7A-interacting MON1-CCZ1 complex subunit 1-like [Ylistrum balloti]|uniref:RAB7A-interacting MON1-CCZ1 complex subunit 1-like n=1 Tax=Ylistrum balloti TaxID=509963 RepID=UPI0029059F24|nr:RAB7A-interacting MON1-CCZ1 complex subunit 1-like [Ylistrum balloti]
MAGTIIREHLRVLQDTCVHELKSIGDLDPLLLTKSKRRCEVCLAGYPDPNVYTPQTLTKLIQEYTQAVLDYTYHEECQLVNEEFPEINAKERIHKIFCHFDQVMELSKKCIPEKEVADVLGSEMNQCLVWRRGALLYMYCKTIKEDPQRADRIGATFIQFVHEGIVELKSILPSPPSPLPGRDKEEMPVKDPTLQLVDMGILNDTHLLGMMYGGEMCYWYYQEQVNKTQSIEFEKDFDAKKTGKEFLLPYIEAVDGVLSAHGWNSQTAKQIIKYFSEH